MPGDCLLLKAVVGRFKYIVMPLSCLVMRISNTYKLFLSFLTQNVMGMEIAVCRDNAAVAIPEGWLLIVRLVLSNTKRYAQVRICIE